MKSATTDSTSAPVAAPAVAPKPASQPTPAPAAPPPTSVPPSPKPVDDSHASARNGLLANAQKIRQELHALHQEFVKAQTDTERSVRLQNLYRRVHFLTATAGLAGCNRIALLSSAFEALLFELTNQPALITPSVRATVATANDFLGRLLERAKEVERPGAAVPRILVVDDDPLSNRLVSSALRYDHLEVRTEEDPFTALEAANQSHYDLFMLDIEMPGLDGFQLCDALRATPEYAKVPVVFVTSHSDFDSRAKSVLSGGNDLISKPVLPLELAVKAVTHLLRANLSQPPA
jgi:CheY-like chemotaxis protein